MEEIKSIGKIKNIFKKYTWKGLTFFVKKCNIISTTKIR